VPCLCFFCNILPLRSQTSTSNIPFSRNVGQYLRTQSISSLIRIYRGSRLLQKTLYKGILDKFCPSVTQPLISIPYNPIVTTL
jgi:hypothetical protein